MQVKPTIHISKRIFDIFLTIFILIIFAPVFILFFILIFIEHIFRGYPLAPLVYHEIRWSAGKPFTLYKYNIFKQNVIDDLKSQEKFIDTKNLERSGDLITVGKFLKQIYLDEIPQFLNVLKGDMSIVGPRPMNMKTHEKLKREGFYAKDTVKAGITGYYQAVHKAQKSKGSQEMLDTYYVNHYLNNPWYTHMLFDIRILLNTLLVLILARGI